jgi:WD40 repeat protein
VAVDGQFCVTAASDSSIIVWNLEQECVLTTIVAHTCAIAAVGILARSEIVIGCDISGNLVMSALNTGAFINKTKLERVPSQIHLSDLGFCCLIFKDQVENSAVTEVILKDFSARTLARKTFEGDCTAAKLIVNLDGTAFLVVAQQTAIVYILTVWDLETVVLGPVDGIVCDIAYSAEETLLLFVLDSGEIHTASFAMGH